MNLLIRAKLHAPVLAVAAQVVAVPFLAFLRFQAPAVALILAPPAVAALARIPAPVKAQVLTQVLTQALYPVQVHRVQLLKYL